MNDELMKQAETRAEMFLNQQYKKVLFMLVESSKSLTVDEIAWETKLTRPQIKNALQSMRQHYAVNIVNTAKSGKGMYRLVGFDEKVKLVKKPTRVVVDLNRNDSLINSVFCPLQKL